MFVRKFFELQENSALAESIDPEKKEFILKQHKLSRADYSKIKTLLGRRPTFSEIGIFSALWNEHCSYKSSKYHLKRLPSKEAALVPSISRILSFTMAKRSFKVNRDSLFKGFSITSTIKSPNIL